LASGLFDGSYPHILEVIDLQTFPVRNRQQTNPSSNQSTHHKNTMADSPILIVIGTNRPNSLSAAVAHYYADLLIKKGQDVQVLALSSLPPDFIKTALYANKGKNPDFNQAKKKMEEARKYVFVVPEYNGSFPGVLKAFIDGLDLPTTFAGKKCALIGVSKGWHGGSMGLSHLTDIFHHLKMDVCPFKVCLPNIIDSRIETVLASTTYKRLLEEQAEAIIDY
jgi:NAD(P)H-dependent FMN reductase